MKWTLLAGFVCGVALVLGACSSNNTSQSTDGNGNEMDGNGNEMDGNGNEMDGNGNEMDTSQMVPEVLQEVAAAYKLALDAVVEAEKDVMTADAPNADDGAKAHARAEIEEAQGLVQKAIDAAKEVYDRVLPDDDVPSGIVSDAKDYLDNSEALKSGPRGVALDAAFNRYSWFGARLVRYAWKASEIDEPRDGSNTVKIIRTPRTKDTSDSSQVQIANTGDDVISKATGFFPEVKYAAGKKVFSADDDEFKVDGYVGHGLTFFSLDQSLQTGLTTTNSGIQIRTGGFRSTPVLASAYDVDYLDMRRKITNVIGDDGTAASRANGWDLKITFNEPLVESRAGNIRTNWFGNGDFYWRGIVKPHPDQLDSSKSATDYVANTFTEFAKGNERLGTYEVWLSNNIDVDRKLEPHASSTGTVMCANERPSSDYGGACPNDDVDYHLDYAAYGLFLFLADSGAFGTVDTTDTTVVSNTDNPNIQGAQRGAGYLSVAGSRVQSMHFGYTAFADSNGRRPRDIGTAVKGATYYGRTIARAFTGQGNIDGAATPENARNRFLRGDVQLTVNIGKGTSATADIRGSLMNFEEWNGDNGWFAYPSGFKVYMNADGSATGNAVSIGLDGKFNGVAKFAAVTGPTGGIQPTLNPLLPTADSTGNKGVDGAIAGGATDGAAGQFKGNFYGDSSDHSELEVAGSWSMGSASATNDGHGYQIVGSFGAQPRPTPPAAAN